jgi:N4-gp56 family major capsid protein
MAQFTWTFDAPSGTYKSHDISEKLYEAAVADTVAMDFVRPVEGFGKRRGEAVTLVRVSAATEPTVATLSETERIPEDEFALTTTSITVSEFGRSIPYTSLSDDLSKFDLENPIQMTLKDQMALVLDSTALAAFKASQVKYRITGVASGTFTTNGTFAGASTANMNVFHVEEIADYLYDTLLCPPLEGGDYVGIFRTLGLRGIKRDPAWDEWHKYTDPGAKYNGEAGRIERIRFVGTNHGTSPASGASSAAVGLGKVGTSNVLGEGVVFGADSVAMAEAMAPELRAAIPSDFGRSKAVAWYGIFQFGVIWNTGNAGQARIVHVGSA